jgi:hypothetical protein
MTQDGQGRYTAFRARGHAGYAEHGKDIVCAAVSVLGVTCVNSLESLLHIMVILEKNRDGLLSFTLPPLLQDDQMHDAQLLMGALYVGLQAIAEEYPDNLSLSITNGGKHHDQT